MKLTKTDLVVYVSVLVIIVSLASIGMELTGKATVTDTATVNVTIATSAAINFTTEFVDFLSGAVNDGTAGATLDTEGTVTGGNWSAVSVGLVLQNIGNVNVTLGLKSDKAAQAYLGGTSPTFKYKVDNTTGNAGACVNNSATTYTAFTTGDISVCDTLQFYDDKDEIDIDIELYIPSDSKTGEQTATITATGTY